MSKKILSTTNKQQGAGSNLMLFNFIFVDIDSLGLIDVRHTPL